MKKGYKVVRYINNRYVSSFHIAHQVVYTPGETSYSPPFCGPLAVFEFRESAVEYMKKEKISFNNLGVSYAVLPVLYTPLRTPMFGYAVWDEHGEGFEAAWLPSDTELAASVEVLLGEDHT